MDGAKLVRDHRPRELIWIGSKVHANTILAVRSKLDHMVLANIDAVQSTTPYQIHPNAARTGTAQFFEYFCADGDTAARLHMLNISDERIHPVGSLQSQTSVPALWGIQTNLTV